MKEPKSPNPRPMPEIKPPKPSLLDTLEVTPFPAYTEWDLIDDDIKAIFKGTQFHYNDPLIAQHIKELKKKG